MEVLTRAAAEQRFGLIDATFVFTDCLPGKQEATYVVRYYPYWDHPTYHHAMEIGKPWKVVGRAEAEQEVHVRLHGVQSVKLRERPQISEWSFPSAHPALFEYEEQLDITCESELAPKALRRKLRAEWVDVLGEGELMRVSGLGRDPIEPFHLGTFPRSLASSIETALSELSVDFRTRVASPASNVPEMLLIDGEDYVLCERLEVELPEFRHHPSWVVLDSSS